jgi:imidazolonepropionase
VISTLLIDCRTATTLLSSAGTPTLLETDDAAVVIEGEHIAWHGSRRDLPERWRSVPAQSCEGGLLTPGLVDAFADVALPERDAGSAAVCDADLDWLLERLDQGVTWFELKTGSNPDIEVALRQLAWGRALCSRAPQRASLTLQVAHLPDDVGDHDERIEALCTQLLPRAHADGTMDAIEVLCEESRDEADGASLGFSLDDASTVLEAAYRKKVPTRMGCERFSDSGGTALAPSFYARCAAHLNHCDKLGIEALHQARTTAMLLPLALRNNQPHPPLAELRALQVPMAVGTGTAQLAGSRPRLPSTSPLVAARQAMQLFDLDESEAFAAITLHATKVLAGPNGPEQGGTISPGAPADLVLWPQSTATTWLAARPSLDAQRIWVGGREINRAKR